MQPNLRKTILNLHLILGLLIGVFLLVLAVTGSIIAFEKEIDRLLNPSFYRVMPQARTLSIDDLVGRVERANPGKQVTNFAISPDAGSADLAILSGATFVTINQYTGEIVGVRNPRSSFVLIAHQIHLRLLGGRTGELIVGIVDLLLIPVVLAGLYLWLPLKRVTVRTGTSRRRFYFDLHNALGFFSSVFILGFAVSGAIIDFEEWTFPAIYGLTASRPVAVPNAPVPVPGATAITADRALAVARAAVPEAAPVAIANSLRARIYRVSLRFPEDRTPGGRTRVWVDQFSGHAILVDSSRTAPLGARVINQNRALHTGDVFGPASRAFNVLVCLALVFQVISGPYLWWAGRKRRSAPVANSQAAINSQP